MNCIILLFLLGCCGGWGNGCRGMGSCGCAGRNIREGQCCGRTEERGNCGCREERRHCKEEGCGCEDRHSHEEDCGCERRERESCAVPGMIPPPWQEYPGFPRRDEKDDCDS